MRTIDAVVLLQEVSRRHEGHHVLLGSLVVSQVTLALELRVVVSLDVVSVTEQVADARSLHVVSGQLHTIAIVLNNRNQTEGSLRARLVYTYQRILIARRVQTFIQR